MIHDSLSWVAMGIQDARDAAQALAAADLLVDADTERLVRLGRAVEAMKRKDLHTPQGFLVGNYFQAIGWNDCLDAIYREAGVEGGEG
jgi:hypothetical protein